MTLVQEIEQAVEYVHRSTRCEPEIAIVLGTGLNALANRIEVEARLDYENVPHFPRATEHTHGELVFGRLGGKTVVALSGRYHFYEGYSLRQVTFPIRVARALGARTLVVSNAAGGLNPQFSAGDLMVITDHINMMGDNPLIGPNHEALGPRFPDMCEPYDKSLIALAERVALRQGVKLQRGVYLACPGPCLETAAEYRYMRTIGADAVGMSTVPEVIVGVHAGMRNIGFSAITDECLPDALKRVNIEQIIATANKVEPILTQIVVSCIEEMTI